VIGDIQLLHPNAADVFEVGSQVNIEWKASSNIGAIKIDYSEDQFESSHLITASTRNTGSFIWHIPNHLEKETWLRVSDASNGSVADISDVPFRVQGTLELTTPLGGENWTLGEEQNIRWLSRGVMPEVRLEYSEDDFKTTRLITDRVPNTGSFRWILPELLSPEIKVRVSATDDPSVFFDTPEPIHILGRIDLISPMGMDRWIVGEQKDIRWSSMGQMPKVALEYSKDHFVNDVHEIANQAPNVGSFFWTVPNDVSTQVSIRIKSYHLVCFKDVFAAVMLFEFKSIACTDCFDKRRPISCKHAVQSGCIAGMIRSPEAIVQIGL